MSNILAVNDVLIVQTVINDPSLQQSAVLSRYWKVASIIPVGTIQFSDVATYFDGLLAPLYKPLIYNTATYNGCRVRRWFPANTDNWQYDNSNAGVGTAGAVGNPSQSAGLLSFIGNTIGRHGAGRQYVPFPSATDNVTYGHPSAGYLANLAALGLALVTQQPVTVAGITANLIPGVFDNVAKAYTSINQYKAEDAWATQKRRGAFGRFNRPPF